MESLPDVLAAPRNAPHDLLARLYREIGISAVATALEITDVALIAQSSAPDTSESAAREAA